MNSENNSTEQWYKLNSMSSVSAYDLAQIIQHLYEIRIGESLFNKLPKEVKHHFQKITENEAKENG